MGRVQDRTGARVDRRYKSVREIHYFRKFETSGTYLMSLW